MVRCPKQAYLSWKEERDAKVLGIPVIAWLIIFLVAAILILICPASFIAFSFAVQMCAVAVGLVSLALLISIPFINNSQEIREGRNQYYHDRAVIMNSDLSDEDKRRLLDLNSTPGDDYGSSIGFFGKLLKFLSHFILGIPRYVILATLLIAGYLFYILYLKEDNGRRRSYWNRLVRDKSQNTSYREYHRNNLLRLGSIPVKPTNNANPSSPTNSGGNL